MSNLDNCFKCSLFKESVQDYANFSFIQEEVKLISDNDLSKFKIEKIEYKCSLYEFKTIDTNKPLLLIPTKDNIKLIEYTLGNLKYFKMHEHANILVIDDRSETNHSETSKKFDANCLRIDTPKGFNFSMLINIGIKLALDRGIKEVILWNNDLWTDSENTFSTLLEKHRKNKCTLSGTKLVYPPFKWDGKDQREDIKQTYGLNKTHRGTVQFGGSSIVYNDNMNNYVAIHRCRFFQPDDIRCNVDKNELFLTGAFLIINTEWLLKTGGLNPSLCKAFQDVDLSYKASKENQKIMYFGENLHFFHDESLSQTQNKFDLQFLSDQVCMHKIWNRLEIEKYVLGASNE